MAFIQRSGRRRTVLCGLGMLSACAADAGSQAASELALPGGAGTSATAAMTSTSAAAAGRPASTTTAGASGSAAGAKPTVVGSAGSVAGSAAASAGTAASAAAGSGAAGVPAAIGGAAGTAGAAGSAQAGAAAAAGGGDANSAALACAGGMPGKASNGGGATGRGNGNVQYQVSADNQIVRLQTTLLVPAKPSGNTTLFLWPGLEPIQGSPHYSPIGTGVLQPVLTWGGSCAPGSIQTSSGSNWWISAQYVNTLGNEMDHRGCHGGDVMNVETGDLLDIDFSVKGTVWTQTVTNRKSGKSVDFDMDLDMQEQRWALFEIEAPTNNKPSEDTVFTNTVLTFQKAEAKACQVNTRGADDYFSAPVASTDGLRCCTDRIVLRVAGAKHSTMDPP